MQHSLATIDYRLATQTYPTHCVWPMQGAASGLSLNLGNQKTNVNEWIQLHAWLKGEINPGYKTFDKIIVWRIVGRIFNMAIITLHTIAGKNGGGRHG